MEDVEQLSQLPVLGDVMGLVDHNQCGSIASAGVAERAGGSGAGDASQVVGSVIAGQELSAHCLRQVVPQRPLQLFHQVLGRGNDQDLVLGAFEQVVIDGLAADHGLSQACGQHQQGAVSAIEVGEDRPQSLVLIGTQRAGREPVGGELVVGVEVGQFLARP